jgi:SAM-dependent methyltransferase
MNTAITEQKPKTKLEFTNCDFCGENRTNLFLEAESEINKEKFRIVRCDNCGLIYLNPRPAKEIIGRYYPVESYYSYQDFTKKRLNWRERIKKISLEGYYDSKNIFKKFLSSVLVRKFMIVVPKGKKGRLLDIGCGSGEFLYQMRNFGWEVFGVEINQESANMGNKRGLNIFCGELGGADFPENYFDVVVLSQTMEHVYSPGSYLEKIHRLLKEGGLLIIGVPNIDCLEIQIFGRSCHILDVPRHLHFFTIASLRNYLEKYGFEVEKVLSKKFSLPLQGIRADLKNFIQNECKDKSSLNKIWMSFSVIFRLLFIKSLRFIIDRDKVNELGFYIAFYARKPVSAEEEKTSK